jgi:hypothetical protein
MKQELNLNIDNTMDLTNDQGQDEFQRLKDIARQSNLEVAAQVMLSQMNSPVINY